MAINTLLTDKRIQKQAIANGLLSPEDLQTYLDNLPDRSDMIMQPEDDGESDSSAEKSHG